MLKKFAVFLLLSFHFNEIQSVINKIFSFHVNSISDLFYWEARLSCINATTEPIIYPVDLASQYSLMSISLFILNQSQQENLAKIIEVLSDNENIQCKVVTDNMTISNTTLKFTFYNFNALLKLQTSFFKTCNSSII